LRRIRPGEEARKLVAQNADVIVCVNELVFLGAWGNLSRCAAARSQIHRVFDADWTLAGLLRKRIDDAIAATCQIIAEPTLRLYKG